MKGFSRFRLGFSRNRAVIPPPALVLTVAALLAAPSEVQRLHAQGSVFLNSYDSGMGIHHIGDSWPVPAGTPIEVLGGPSLATLSPIVNSAGQGPIFQIAAEGVYAKWPDRGSFFDVGYGAVPGVPSLGTAWFVVLAWLGPPTAQGWQAADIGGWCRWSQQVGTTDHPAILNMPAPLFMGLDFSHDYIPEPPSVVLASVGMWCLVSRFLGTRRRCHVFLGSS